jgi:hypothetical protein
VPRANGSIARTGSCGSCRASRASFVDPNSINGTELRAIVDTARPLACRIYPTPLEFEGRAQPRQTKPAEVRDLNAHCIGRN